MSARVYYEFMRTVELPGGTTPLDEKMWAGSLTPLMTETDLMLPTFPRSDVDVLLAIGRPRLAALLIEHGLVSDDPSIVEPGTFSFRKLS